jgi:hypothetical protein
VQTLEKQPLPRDRFRVWVPLGMVERALGMGDGRLERLHRAATTAGYGLASAQATRALRGELVL